MTELPPAVARFVADADPFVRGTEKAVGQARKFDASASKAALAARRMGLEAKEAGEKAALAGRLAAEGAEKAAKGLLKEGEAARLAARAVRELERAEIKQAAAAIAASEASEKATRASRAQVTSSTQGAKSAALMRNELVTLAAAGAAIAPAFVAAGGGVGAFGALTVPTIKKVIDAQTEMADTWDSLSKRQRVSAVATRGLVEQYKGLAKAVEPETLKVYNGALAITAQVMPRLEPIARAGSRALLAFEDSLGRALDSPEARQFTSWVESQAGPSIGALGDTLGSTAHLAASLTQSLAPLATTGLGVVSMAANLLAKLSDLSPELAQLAVLGIGLRGPLSGAGDLMGKLGGKARAFSAASKGASLATKALNLATAAGPNLYMAAGLAIAYFGLKALNAKSSTDKLVESMTVANRAFGNNLSGYQAMNRALDAQLVPATQRADAMTKQLAGNVTASNVQLYQGAKAAQALTGEWVSAAKSDVDKKITNVRTGAQALARQYGITTSQAISLADAVGVDMSKGITETGQVVASTAARFDTYRRAVEMANQPTRVVAQAWQDAANRALSLTDRVNALQSAMDAFANPALAMLSATTRMKEAVAASEAVMKKSKSTGLERAHALETQLAAVRDLAQAEFRASGDTRRANAAMLAQAPALLRLAGGSRTGRAAIEGLIQSMGGSISRTRSAITVTDRLGNRIRILPNGKVIKIKADTGQAWGAIGSLISRVNSLPSGKTVTVTYVQRGPGLSAAVPSYANRLLGRASGGPVDGPGTETSDSIPAWLSKNEFVINAAMTRRYRPIVEAINAGTYAGGGLVGYAAGGKVQTKTHVGGVDISIAAWRNLGLQLGKDFMKAMTGSKSEIASMDRRLEKAIAKLFAGKRTTLDNRLIAYLDKHSSRLEALAVRRDAASKAYTAGKEYASTLTGNARTFAGLSALDGPTSAGQIRQGLTMKLSAMRRFASLVKSLGKRGLSKSLLRQVLDMGPEEGMQYAEMLASASKGTLSDINAVQKSIDASSRSLGRSGADMLYDAGKNAGKGFLTGLQAEMKSLDKTMDRLAARMAKGIKKALKIKSPSQHPEILQAGAMTVAGIAVGMDRSHRLLDTSNQRIAARLARPRGVTRPPSVPLSGRGPGGGTIVYVTVQGSVIAERDLQRVVQKQTLRYERRNPSNGLSRASR